MKDRRCCCGQPQEQDIEVTLSVSQKRVFAEVARKTAYIGVKASGEKDDFDRVTVVDEDSPELKELWDEARVELVNALQSRLVREGFHVEQTEDESEGSEPTTDEPEEQNEDEPDIYEVVLHLWPTFRQVLIPSMNNELYSYFVRALIAKWCMLIHHDDAQIYAISSELQLASLTSNITRKTFKRKLNPW